MEGTKYLNPSTTEFLDQFRRGLSGVQDISGEFDHRNRMLKAAGGFSFVYATDWALQDAPRVQVSLRCFCLVYEHDVPPAPGLLQRTTSTTRRCTRSYRSNSKDDKSEYRYYYFSLASFAFFYSI